MTWMNTSFDQLLDMTIPCLSMQIQTFSIIAIKHFMASPIHFLLVLFVKFFKHDVIGNFDGTLSMK